MHMPKKITVSLSAQPQEGIMYVVCITVVLRSIVQ